MRLLDRRIADAALRFAHSYPLHEACSAVTATHINWESLFTGVQMLPHSLRAVPLDYGN